MFLKKSKKNPQNVRAILDASKLAHCAGDTYSDPALLLASIFVVYFSAARSGGDEERKKGRTKLIAINKMQ